VPAEQMPPLLAAADALLVHLGMSAASETVVPTKTIAYLAAGRPIVMAARGVAADLITSSGSGVALEPDRPADLAAVLDSLASRPPDERARMGERGRVYFEAHHAPTDHLELRGGEAAVASADRRRARASPATAPQRGAFVGVEHRRPPHDGREEQAPTSRRRRTASMTAAALPDAQRHRARCRAAAPEQDGRPQPSWWRSERTEPDDGERRE
jgi:hypothetical protein